MINGYPISINWEKENVPAILEAWFAGQEQGTAMADIIFGDYNPGGKLPVTFYKSTNDLPHISDYDITKGRNILVL
jgi:beta-glucosidase